ncbi:GlxA family transcriptional regulator [Comamonas sp. UBA7528]|uniref:GlxA family transcriptional regulator n=1 Tax=Comamonas sp. UBA7528 TaxID=1946391 RepID=UPI0025BF7C76|nr:GlxA family transcriptional regulator [Comamonas sp. UBA7528]
MSGTRNPRHIVILGVPPILELDMAGPLTVFGHAAIDAMRHGGADGSEPYKVTVASASENREMRGSSGLVTVANVHYSEIQEPVDTLIVISGAQRADISTDPALCEWLRRSSANARRTCSICTGAFVLASAGLLDGRRAATHWAYAEELGTCYPAVQVDANPIWVQDGPVYTSAGVTAGIDLALSLVEDDLGTKTALEIARMLVVFLKRPGGQRQFSTVLSAQQSTTRTSFTDLVAWISENLDKPLNVEALADRVVMSPRNFARVFATEVGVPPAQYLRRMRIEAARALLEQTARGMDDIASRCGFGSDEAMRRAFLEDIGVTPGQYRASFGSGRLVRS